MKEKWVETANRFVAFFDIMGFKDLVARKNHADIVELLNSLSETRLKLQEANNRNFHEGKTILGETRSFTFSDSIIFISKGDKIEDSNKLLIDCFMFMKHSYKSQIPVKGAVAFGQITVNEDTMVYFGQPIIDAYLLHEDLHLYSVVADHSYENQIKLLGLRTIEDFFEFYKTPLKSGRAYHHVLRPLSDDRDETILNLKKSYAKVTGKPRQYIDNTIDFLKTATFKKSKNI